MKAIIFDCFGVLITDMLAVLITGLRDDPAKQQIAHDALRAANKGLIERAESSRIIAGTLGLSVAEYRTKIDEGEVRNTELLSYIQKLRGNYQTAMLSNITRAGLDHRFSEQELQTYFDAVVVSGEVGFAKPEPEIYEITADRLGVRLEDCVFTDDREEFCEAARAVGMKAIVYTDFAQFRVELERLLNSPAK